MARSLVVGAVVAVLGATVGSECVLAAEWDSPRYVPKGYQYCANHFGKDNYIHGFPLGESLVAAPKGLHGSTRRI